jgi:hypothetical protein
MYVLKGEWCGYKATLSISDANERWRVEPVSVLPGLSPRWVVTDGTQMIGEHYSEFRAVAEARRRNNHVGKGYCFEARTGKYLTQPYYGRYDTEQEAAEAARLKRNLAKERRATRLPKAYQHPKSGKWTTQPYYGRYDTEQEALEAARLKTNLSDRKRTPAKLATGMYQVRVRGEYYGNFMSKGHSILARDFVLHHLGKEKKFPDYLMPEAFVGDYLRQFVGHKPKMATSEEAAEYMRRVDELNGVQPRVVVPPEQDDSDIQRVADMKWRNV